MKLTTLTCKALCSVEPPYVYHVWPDAVWAIIALLALIACLLAIFRP